ncbi:c-type cytochrome domain-containing protein [Aquirufa nivalisilvae]|uniref:c-type cytochrome domain-containing protein n=1 Tax=Aquirufa nivalisilvae TaxID=2516557 RepID=UPI0022A96DBF|nr:c-type cytochrome domain-containing protein [Aquirufa nivalisilvae]MCZ2479732.1 cytochrome C [Aquirufa nivalisilvae]
MKNSKLTGILEQVLLASFFFVGFLLVFESELKIPLFLQPFGRLHTLLLHFPIVLLLLAMFMEFFSFQANLEENKTYLQITQLLILVGALSSGITVMMGIFLAKEPGYGGGDLYWHRWLGVGTYLFASLIYWIRSRSWYQVTWAKCMSISMALMLALVGHFGGNLTHGGNFVLEPLMKNQAVPLEEAVVFQDLVQPILEKKCVACHNPDKIKGELLLTDAKSISKGGKTGPLFVAGKPELSLLIQRAHLSIDDKKHMPPIGKPQLSDDELQLLSWWVKEKASFTKKVVDLASTDSLRILSTKLLASSGPKEEEFDFQEADEKTIQKLSNEYRTIMLFAKDSPALSVNFFNKAQYKAPKLEELKEIKEQIVTLSLAKMPVQNADLAFVKIFEHLHTLNLNFTDISEVGLKELAGMKELMVLSISGTKLKAAGLASALKAIPNLKKVYVWDAGLSREDIQILQKQLKGIQVVGGFQDDGSNPLKLNPPQVKNPSTIFDEYIEAQLGHPIKGVEIRYTTDGSIPDSAKSSIFAGNLRLNQNTSIRARAFKPGWIGSEEAIFDFYRGHFRPDSAVLLTPLNRVHQAAGAKTFFDGRLGSFNANSPAWANNWAGVRNNDLVLVTMFKQAITLSSVELRIMVETQTGIFPPESVEVWGATIENQWKLMAKFKPAIPKENFPHTLPLIGTRFKPSTVKYIKIVAKPLEKIPGWHPSKDKRALFLVDEMFFN